VVAVPESIRAYVPEGRGYFGVDAARIVRAAL
jgi:hypothetical protein